MSGGRGERERGGRGGRGRVGSRALVCAYVLAQLRERAGEKLCGREQAGVRLSRGDGAVAGDAAIPGITFRDRYRARNQGYGKGRDGVRFRARARARVREGAGQV